ncbi:MAG: CPBP family intramembrane metalloprotease [Mediterranea sp.]|jgi:membrane protease YdiL (CAAX protease family)|nr:CPBP family intramembrane metalloprotease [Mediterranea sp.]
MKKAIVLALMYAFVFQFVALFLGYVIFYGYAHFAHTEVNNTAFLLFTLLTSYVFTFIYLYKKGYVHNDHKLYALVSARFLGVTLAVGLSAIAWVSFLMSYLTFLPNWITDASERLMTNPLGIFAIALAAPFIEELVFRGGVLKELLKRYRPWTAIVMSALIFGIIHINPIQVVGGISIGLLLGWLYYKTRSILPSTMLHVVNNSLAVYEYIHYGENSDEWANNLNIAVLIVVLVITALILIAGIRWLNKTTYTPVHTSASALP